MKKISVREILQQHGRWINSSELVKLICQKNEVTPRRAYQLIKRAYKCKEIKKHIFPDRTVIYGLTEFGPPILRKLLPKDILKILSDAERLFQDLSKSTDICNELQSDHVKKEILSIMDALKMQENLPKAHMLNWAIRATMELSMPELLWEISGMREDKIRENLALANRLSFYREFVTAYAFQKFGLKNHYELAKRVSEWQPNTLVRDEYALSVLKPYSKPERCFVLSVTLSAWYGPLHRLRETIIASKETRVLLMSPFPEDKTWNLFQEEYEAPIKPSRFLYPYWKDLFRRICVLLDNLYSLSDLFKHHKIQVKLYTNFKPPVRFTLYPSKICTIFPTPFRFAGDFYTFCGKITDKEALQLLESKYNELWNGPNRDVCLKKKALNIFSESILQSYANSIIQENLLTKESFYQLKEWALSHGPLATQIFAKLQKFLKS